MESKRSEAKHRISSKSLVQLASRTMSYEDFGRSVFRQMLLQAVHKFENVPTTGEISLSFDVDCKATVGIVRKPSNIVGIGFGLALEFALGETVYLEDSTDLSLMEDMKDVAWKSTGSGR